ncbi:hypothetical protein AERO8C_70382 [Aeromonas veronii]|uniref:Uncharacterized protein n=1 Tax=Aeromonas veronii TaxID=654 RepID=A0A653LBW4_AERVE|nr:hypothetical protein AERO8C_70382 [Aeromonas veronii]
MESLVRTKYHYWLNRPAGQSKTSTGCQHSDRQDDPPISHNHIRSRMVIFTKIWSKWLSKFVCLFWFK